MILRRRHGLQAAAACTSPHLGERSPRRLGLDARNSETSRTARAARAMAAALTVFALAAGTGCSVVRDQQTVGTYVDDSVITTRVKAKFAEDRIVSAMALSVETFKGVVQLSGVAKSADERALAEKLARATSGVVSVRNDIRVSG